MRRTVTALLVLSLAAGAIPREEACASALGQLEGLAGRSAGSVNVPMPSAPSPVGGMGAVKGLAGAASGKGMSGLNALDFGMQLLNILDAMDAPSPAAVQQQQLREQQQREQERLKALRQQSAEQLRSSWDNADAAHADAVEGVLDVPIRQGTAFFGMPGNPSGGTLPGAPAGAQGGVSGATAPAASSQPAPPATAPAAAVRPVRQPVQNATAVQQAPETTTELSAPHAEILAKGAEEFSRNAAKDMLENALEKGIALLPNQWRAELIYEHQKKMRGFIDEMFTHLDARRLVNTIARGTPSEMAELEQEISRGTRESARKLVMSDDLLQDEEPTYALKLFKGEKVSAAETWSLIKGRVYNAGIEKTTGNLLFGGD